MSARVSANRKLYCPWTTEIQDSNNLVDDLREAFAHAMFTASTYHYTSPYRIEGKVENVKVT